MKKIFILAVVIAIIGILCALIFNNHESENDVKNPAEKPWTVGDTVETTETPTEKAVFDDAVMCFSDFINTELREKYTFLAETTVYRTLDFSSAVLGLYVYDIDSDGTDELSVVCTDDGNIRLDVYEFTDGKTELSASLDLTLDPEDSVLFTKEVTADTNVAARMTIYPNGNERAFCLTCERADGSISYNSYTVVFSYSEGEITLRNSFRLRTEDNRLSLVNTLDGTPLYTVIGSSAEPATDTEISEDVTEADITVESDFESLSDAFNNAFSNIGLKAPDVASDGSVLTKNKVTPVESEQKIFEFAGGNGEVMFSENGFLHSFILDI